MVPDGFALAGTSWSIPVGRAVAPVWSVQRTSGGGTHLTKMLAYANPVLRLMECCTTQAGTRPLSGAATRCHRFST
jgi:hypothetical protein